MRVIDRVDQADAAIVGELYPMLRRFAAVVAPWQMDPDDVLHGTLVDVLRTPRLKDLANPAGYLRKAIVNHVRSEARRQKRGKTLLSRVGASAASEVTVSYPSDVAELMRLRPIDRAVLFLHDIEGYSFDEVAEMVGISAGNARMTASRGRRRLRTALLQEERQ